MKTTDDGNVVKSAPPSPAGGSDALTDFAKFKVWAEQHLGQGYPLNTEDGTFTNPVTRWAFKGFCAGLDLATPPQSSGQTDLAMRLREHDDPRLYREADVLMAEAADALDQRASQPSAPQASGDAGAALPDFHVNIEFDEDGPRVVVWDGDRKLYDETYRISPVLDLPKRLRAYARKHVRGRECTMLLDAAYEIERLSKACNLAATMPSAAPSGEDISYEIMQDDMQVAATSGKDAYSEILRYANQYVQDGPIEIIKCVRTTLAVSTPSPLLGDAT